MVDVCEFRQLSTDLASFIYEYSWQDNHGMVNSVTDNWVNSEYMYSERLRTDFEMRGTQLSWGASTFASQILLAQLFELLELIIHSYYRYAIQRKILPDSSLNIDKTIIEYSFLLSLKLEVLMYEGISWAKFIEWFLCCVTIAKAPLHIVNFVKKYKQCTNGVHFNVQD